MKKILLLACVLLLVGCAAPYNIRKGMTLAELKDTTGEPIYKNKVIDYEIYLYDYKNREKVKGSYGRVTHFFLIKDGIVVHEVKATRGDWYYHNTEGYKGLIEFWLKETSNEDLLKDFDCIKHKTIRIGMCAMPVLLSLGEPYDIIEESSGLSPSWDYSTQGVEPKYVEFFLGKVNCVRTIR